MRKFTLKNTVGFTLVEMIIVVAIVAILAAIAIPNFTLHTRRARASEAVATMSMIRQAMRDYFINNAIHYDVDGGDIDNNIPLAANIDTTTGAVTGSDDGLDIDLGVVQYFSNAAFSVDAIDHNANAPFADPDEVDFVITANGSNSNACGTSDCATSSAAVSAYRLEMDNTGRTFVSFDSGTNWSAY